MPIYEYRCENGHTFEVMQRMTDDPVSSCSTCAAPVQRVFQGKGFYNTDYGTQRRNRELERSGEGGADKADAKKDTTGEAKKGDSASTAKKTGESAGGAG
jgi:putative FmdB family regulatory protein